MLFQRKENGPSIGPLGRNKHPTTTDEIRPKIRKLTQLNVTCG
jgi:hypothetical protein